MLQLETVALPVVRSHGHGYPFCVSVLQQDATRCERPTELLSEALASTTLQMPTAREGPAAADWYFQRCVRLMLHLQRRVLLPGLF